MLCVFKCRKAGDVELLGQLNSCLQIKHLSFRIELTVLDSIQPFVKIQLRFFRGRGDDIVDSAVPKSVAEFSVEIELLLGKEDLSLSD
jgi:hypothetical protein